VWGRLNFPGVERGTAKGQNDFKAGSSRKVSSAGSQGLAGKLFQGERRKSEDLPRFPIRPRAEDVSPNDNGLHEERGIKETRPTRRQEMLHLPSTVPGASSRKKLRRDHARGATNRGSSKKTKAAGIRRRPTNPRGRRKWGESRIVKRRERGAATGMAAFLGKEGGYGRKRRV